MQQLHSIAQENLGVEFLGAVRRQQVMQVEGQRRIADSLAGSVARRQTDITPGGVRRDLIEKKVEATSAVSGFASIASIRSGGNALTTRHCPRRPEVVVDHAVVEQILQHGGHGGDGQRGAHVFPPPPLQILLEGERVVARRGAGRGVALSGITARTSTRPMVILIVGAAASGAGGGIAARSDDGLPPSWPARRSDVGVTSVGPDRDEGVIGAARPCAGVNGSASGAPGTSPSAGLSHAGRRAMARGPGPPDGSRLSADPQAVNAPAPRFERDPRAIRRQRRPAD